MARAAVRPTGTAGRRWIRTGPGRAPLALLVALSLGGCEFELLDPPGSPSHTVFFARLAFDGGEHETSFDGTLRLGADGDGLAALTDPGIRVGDRPLQPDSMVAADELRYRDRWAGASLADILGVATLVPPGVEGLRPEGVPFFTIERAGPDTVSARMGDILELPIRFVGRSTARPARERWSVRVESGGSTVSTIIRDTPPARIRIPIDFTVDTGSVELDYFAQWDREPAPDYEVILQVSSRLVWVLLPVTAAPAGG